MTHMDTSDLQRVSHMDETDLHGWVGDVVVGDEAVFSGVCGETARCAASHRVHAGTTQARWANSIVSPQNLSENEFKCVVSPNTYVKLQGNQMDRFCKTVKTKEKPE